MWNLPIARRPKREETARVSQRGKKKGIFWQHRAKQQFAHAGAQHAGFFADRSFRGQAAGVRAGQSMVMSRRLGNRLPDSRQGRRIAEGSFDHDYVI
jgi:hypothetical protein